MGVLPISRLRLQDEKVDLTTCLPVSNYEPDGRGYYYDYWVNYCDGQPTFFSTYHFNQLKREWGADYHGVIGKDHPPYIKFADPAMLTLFLLRYS